MRNVVFSGILCLVLLQALGCDSGSDLQGATSRADLYCVATQPQPPDVGEYLDMPESGVIAIDYGATDIKTVKRRYLFIRNTGQSDLELLEIVIDPPSGLAPFHLRCQSGDQFVSDCPRPITAGPGQDLIFELDYAPEAAGSHAAGIKLLLNTPDHQPVEVRLSGEAVQTRIRVCISDCVGDQGGAECQAAEEICGGELVADFGDLGPGESRVRRVRVQNAGDRDLVISWVQIAGDDFGEFAWTATSGELPGILGTGEEGLLEVTYKPASGGEHFAGLQIRSDGGDVEVGLSGKMLAPRVCAEPLMLDFGNVALGEPAELSFTLANCGLADLTVENIELNADSSPDFAVLTSAPAGALPPGGSVEVRVTYDPQQAGSDSGGVDIYSDDLTSDPATHLTGTVGLWGRGVVMECQIVATPFQVNFGGVEAGQFYDQRVVVSNQGTIDCTFDSAVIGAGAEFTVQSSPADGTVFAPGEILEVTVRYAPVDLGADSGELHISGSDADGSPIVVQLAGEGIEQAACDLTVSPAYLNFGVVEPYHLRRLQVQLQNRGPAPCHITDLQIHPSVTYASDFSITAGPTGQLDLARYGQPGDRADIEVTFAPDEEGEHAGALWFHTDDDPDFQVGQGICVKPGLPPQSPGPGDACIGLAGNSRQSDLEVVPGHLDFGVVTVGCNSAELGVTVYNMGYFTIQVQDILLDVPNDPNFEIVSAPATPFSLGWSERFEVSLRYHPQDENTHSNALVIETDDFDIPRMIVPLRGTGTHTTSQTDVFTQPVEDRADVLFVVDNSTSMDEEQIALAANFDSFINWAINQDADFQIGVITTMASGTEYSQGDPPRDIEAGELVAAPGRDKILTKSTPDLTDAFAENVRVGTSSTASTEQGFQAAQLALSPPKINSANAGFIRDDSRLYVIVVSDENDQSDGDLDYYLDFFSNIKGPRNTEYLDISAVVGDSPDGCDGPGGTADPCTRYIEMANLTGGVFESICTSNWGGALQNIGLDAFAGLRDFPLTRPADQSSISVLVDSVPVDRAACAGCAGGWTYYPDTNSVYFGDGVVPDKGQTIEISYDTVCAGG